MAKHYCVGNVTVKKREGTLRVWVGGKCQSLLYRVWIDLYRRPSYIEDIHTWAMIRDHKAHLKKDLPSCSLRTLARNE